MIVQHAIDVWAESSDSKHYSLKWLLLDSTSLEVMASSFLAGRAAGHEVDIMVKFVAWLGLFRLGGWVTAAGDIRATRQTTWLDIGVASHVRRWHVNTFAAITMLPNHLFQLNHQLFKSWPAIWVHLFFFTKKKNTSLKSQIEHFPSITVFF